MLLLSTDHCGTELSNLNWTAHLKLSNVQWSSVHLPLKSLGSDNYVVLMTSVSEKKNFSFWKKNGFLVTCKFTEVFSVIRCQTRVKFQWGRKPLKLQNKSYPAGYDGLSTSLKLPELQGETWTCQAGQQNQFSSLLAETYTKCFMKNVRFWGSWRTLCRIALSFSWTHLHIMMYRYSMRTPLQAFTATESIRFSRDNLSTLWSYLSPVVG